MSSGDGGSERVDLGVLFVHGIGNQRETSTLKEGGGLAASLRRWRAPAAVDEFDHPPAPPCPAHQRVRIGGPGGLNAVLTEGWWASTVPAPGTWTLLKWLLMVVPLVVPRVLDAGLRRSSARMDAADWWRPLFFGSGVVRLAQNVVVVVATLTILVVLIALWALALPRTGLDRIRGAEPRAGDAPVLPALVAGAAGGALALVALGGGIGKIVPVALVVLAAIIGLTVPRILNTTIANFLGDCYALLHQREVERRMVSRVEACLAWLEGQADGAPIVIVAHSQGAEIVRRVIAERAQAVRGLVTYGSGIVKLDAVERLQGAPWRASAALLLRVGSAALVVAAAFVVVRGWPAIDALAVGLALLTAAQVPLAAARGVLQSVVGERYPKERFGFGSEKVGRWVDLCTANDPVSEGVLPLEEPWGCSSEIVNDRVLLLDHVRYWANVEAFRAPMILELAGIVGRGQDEDVWAAVRAAGAERARRVAHRVHLRVAFLAAAITSIVFVDGLAQFILAGIAVLAAAAVERRLIARARARARAWSPCPAAGS